MPSLNTPFDQVLRLVDQTFRFVAVDVETANSRSSSICQLGLATVGVDGAIQTLSFLVDPEEGFAGFNTQLHGIGADTVHGEPAFPQVIETVRDLLQRHPLIQHSAFDKRAINGACERYGLPEIDATWHDSVGIARRAWPELKGNGGHGLGNLKTHLDLDFLHHDAAEDAKAAAQVVLLAEQRTGHDFTLLTGRQTRNPRGGGKSVSVDGDKSGPLFGHVACFTGKLTLSRADAAARAAKAGISVRSRLTDTTTLLVVGGPEMSLLGEVPKSSKHRRAEALSANGHAIRILRETEFLAMIEG